ncbi:methylenetetrahydrofolate reductase [NAD(P)H] [Gammaproteobacteria bacterium AH-315-C21]|nr:methylenetetrahydrofolate reductase [NAD(P)H] [Gammaproteobacteria bacterium AH-315-C21]
MENDQRTISFEFFPPKNEQAAERLAQTSAELAKLEPEFFSVTFGAGGSTRNNTLECVSSINSNTGIDVAPHLSCIGSTEESIRELLEVYQSQGIKRIVALRGDMPSGMRDPGELNHANELVEFIRKTTGDHFHIEVAAYPEFHPQARSAQEDVANFKRKVDAGANSALTQYFFNSDAYFRFLDDCSAAGIDIPIVPGIMPITNYIQLARFSDACGAEIPRWIRRRLEGFGDDIESLRAFGTDIMTELCATLLEGDAPGLHFYTMNQTRATLAIWQQLQG